jgi:hypothetical protein
MAAALVFSALTTAQKHSNGWYWTPGLCKSKLINSGIDFSDGRYVRASAVRCFGRLNCLVKDGVVRYDHFDVAMLDRNGYVRTLNVEVTGKADGRFTQMRVWPAARWDNLQYALGAARVTPVDPSRCRRE